MKKRAIGRKVVVRLVEFERFFEALGRLVAQKPRILSIFGPCGCLADHPEQQDPLGHVNDPRSTAGWIHACADAGGLLRLYAQQIPLHDENEILPMTARAALGGNDQENPVRLRHGPGVISMKRTASTVRAGRRHQVQVRFCQAVRR